MITSFTMDFITNGSRTHPRIYRFISNLYRHHPNSINLAILAVVTAPQLAVLLMKSRFDALSRKKEKLNKPALKLRSYLDCPLKVALPITVPEAWEVVKFMHGQEITTDDTRRAHWQIVSVDDYLRIAQFTLRYTHNPIGIKASRLYARELNCTARVTGGGLSSQVELTFHARSAMDYETVRAIVDRTRECVEERKVETPAA